MSEFSDERRFRLHVVEVWNCRNAFEFPCPERFKKLESTEDPEVGFCKICQERVHRCHTPAEFVEHAKLGHCVAIPETFEPRRGIRGSWRGRPSRDTVERYEKHVQEVEAWWHGVLAQKPTFAPEAIAEIARMFGPQFPESLEP
jgi:hypothetical protein